MTPIRWQNVKDILAEALEQQPNELEAFLDQTCGEDRSLYAEVKSLLPFYQQVGDFLEPPITDPSSEVNTLRFRDDQVTVKQSSPLPLLTINTTLQNRYLIIRKIGQGGMGAVYEARDQRLGVTVALKETILKDAQMLKAFEREAHLLAKLRHPMLPVVSDHFSEGDGHYLVMQYIPGDDLSELLQRKRGPLAPELVLQWADKLLLLLEYLHTYQQPIIHRDIKPNNLKLTQQGEIVLLDFGLAKGAVARHSLTGESSLMGYTPHFSPLEQIQGLGSDARSDLYALAATIYQLLTNEKPPDAMTRALSVLNQQSDPLQKADILNPNVSPAVADLLQRTMSQNASQRPESAAAMRRLLREAADGNYQIVPVDQVRQPGQIGQIAQIGQIGQGTHLEQQPLNLPVDLGPKGRLTNILQGNRRWRVIIAIAALLVVATSIPLTRIYLARASAQANTANLNAMAERLPRHFGDPGFKGDLISLDVEGVQFKDVLRFLSDNYDFNFITDESIREIKVTVKARDIPWDEMFGSLCRAHNLTFKRDGQFITITPINLANSAEQNVKTQLNGD